MLHFFENIFPMKDIDSTSIFSSKLIPQLITSGESSEQLHEKVLEGQ